MKKNEWDFDNVPDEEVVACCLWEYARESASFTKSALHYAEQLDPTRKDQRPEPPADQEYEDFLRAFWDSSAACMELYATILNHGGSASQPWQLIGAETRQRLCQQAGQDQCSAPLEPARLRQLEALWKANLEGWMPVRNQPGYDPEEDFMAYEEACAILTGEGDGGEKHGLAVAAFAVDFRKFNDKQICVAFRRWLKANRTKDCPEPIARGHKLRDWQVALNRLGMLRLLHHFTLREMPEQCPEAWRALTGYDWYKERKRTAKTFRKLFPFLPKSEMPISWPTKGGRSNWVANTS